MFNTILTRFLDQTAIFLDYIESLKTKIPLIDELNPQPVIIKTIS